jgi:hypothetical protein
MERVRLAYRDHDRTPVIFAIQAMARHYDVDVQVLHIPGLEESEAALFDDRCDVLIEHTEYVFGEPHRGRNFSMFCAPVISSGLHLVVRPHVQSTAELAGGTFAVRSTGRPFTINARIRKMGLENQVGTVIVADKEVGRWGQWKRVASGECIATFMSPLYLPPALEAGLKILPVVDIEVVGHYAQGCLTSFAREHDQLMRQYVRGVIHALCLLTLRPDAAFEMVAPECMQRMRIADRQEMRRQFDAIVEGLRVRPYPTPEAVTTTYESAKLEYAGADGINPLSVWDLHWVKQLDDEGFVDARVEELTR